MRKARHIRCFDYVNHPYTKVREALKVGAAPVFNRATKGASARAGAVASQLRVMIAGIEVAKDVEIKVHKVEETPGATKLPPTTRVSFEWKAKSSPGLFPLMRAELAAYPLTSTETQLDFSGDYQVPLGLVGKGLDAAVGNRIAEASVHRFVSEVARYLRKSLR
jgi:hypothetical protein